MAPCKAHASGGYGILRTRPVLRSCGHLRSSSRPDAVIPVSPLNSILSALIGQLICAALCRQLHSLPYPFPVVRTSQWIFLWFSTRRCSLPYFPLLPPPRPFFRRESPAARKL